MAKAKITLSSGAIAEIEGTAEEVHDLLSFYEGKKITYKKLKVVPHKTKQKVPDDKRPSSDEIVRIVNLIKTCKEADGIEKNILSKSKEANRVLLPLYIIHEYMDSAFGLATVEISKITNEIGKSFGVTRQNANRALVRSPESKYVLGDRTRKQGSGARYTLNDRGVAYLKSIIAEN